MRILIIFAILLTVALCQQPEFELKFHMPQSGIEDFLKGFLEGLGVKEDIQKLLECLKGAEHVLEKIKEALEHLKHININELKKGLGLLFSALKEFLNVLKPCAATNSIIHKLINAITSVNIMKIVYHIITHPTAFVHDVESSIVCFAKGDLHCAGKGIGDLLRILFLTRMENEKEADSFAEYVKGF